MKNLDTMLKELDDPELKKIGDIVENLIIASLLLSCAKTPVDWHFITYFIEWLSSSILLQQGDRHPTDRTYAIPLQPFFYTLFMEVVSLVTVQSYQLVAFLVVLLTDYTFFHLLVLRVLELSACETS